MSLLELIRTVNQNGFIIAVVVLLLGCIKLPKYEINIWGLFIQKVNKDINKKLDMLSDKILTVEDKLDKHILDDQRDEMDDIRSRILNYASILKRRDDPLSAEQYEDAIAAIDKYEKYCLDHPDYPNMKAITSIEFLKEAYKEFFKEN